MSLYGQLRSVIQWTDPAPELLFERFTDRGDEIKNASKLIVGPGQGCVFVYQGAVRAVLVREGTVDLSTDNLPFLTTLTKVLQGFESEHKVGLYFFRTAHILNRKWGTVAPIKYEDPRYKFPVGLRAFGNYSLRITEPETFFRNVVAGAHHYQIKQLQDVMLSRMTQPLSDLLATAKFSYAEIDAHREELAQALYQKVAPVFSQLGFEILDFRIEGNSFDEATEARIGRIADISAEAQAAQAAGIDYATLQRLDALRDAARNEGTGGIGVVLGASAGLGQMMAPAATAPVTAAPVAAAEEPLQRLEKLKTLFDKGLITADEYQSKKAEILAKL